MRGVAALVRDSAGGLDKVFEESTEAEGPRKGSHADHLPNDKFHADFSAAGFEVRCVKDTCEQCKM
jgi:hypothetical protein